jgi:sialate O-acetylesterase
MAMRTILSLVFAFLMIDSMAAVVPSTYFSDGMVLQRNKPIAVFGTANSGESVSVQLGTDTKTIVTPSDGKWKLFLDPKAAGGPYVVTIKGTNTITINDVYVGEVWFVSGQSNAAGTIGGNGVGPDDKTYFDITKPDNVQNDNYPLVRMHMLGGRWLGAEKQDPQWDNKQYFSQLGYFFARELHKKLGIAVAVIHRAQVASPIEVFLDPLTLASETSVPTDPVPGSYYNPNIAPFVGYTIQGTLWSQGENNASFETAEYGKRLRNMIKNWRTLWGDDFYFFCVQLPRISDQYHSLQLPTQPILEDGWVNVQAAQFDMMSVAKTATFTTTDICDGNIHPRNKLEICERMVNVAQKMIFGNTTSAEGLGPVYISKSISGNKLTLNFIHAAGLKFANGDTQLKGMAIADAAGNWRFANGKIIGNSIELSHPDIASPTQARYMWSANPILGNLVNGDNIGTLTFNSNTNFITWENTNTNAPITGVTISSNSINLNIGTSQKLNASVYPLTANQSVSWTSSNTSVATVSNTGLVTANALGNAIITATSVQDGSKQGTSSVTVSAPSSSLPSNVALNKPTTAKSNYTNSTSSFANDGTLDTKWVANATKVDEWWQVDLLNNYNLSSTEISWEYNGALSPYTYEIQSSSDGINWSLLVDKSSNTANEAVTTDVFSKNKIRYVKILFKAGGNINSWAVMEEFKVFGVLSDDITTDVFEENVDNNTVHISPNPAQDYILVDVQKYRAIAIYDLTGSKLVTQSISEAKISINHLPIGLYVVEMVDKNGTIFKQKLVVNK